MTITTIVIAVLSLIYAFYILKVSKYHSKKYNKTFEKHFPDIETSFNDNRNVIYKIMRGIENKIKNSSDPSKEVFYLKGEFYNLINEPDVGDTFILITVFAAIGIGYINTLNDNRAYLSYILLCVVVMAFLWVVRQRHLRGINTKFYKMCIFVLESYEFKIPKTRNRN